MCLEPRSSERPGHFPIAASDARLADGESLAQVGCRCATGWLTIHVTWMVPHISCSGNVTPPRVTLAKRSVPGRVKFEGTLVGKVMNT